MTDTVHPRRARSVAAIALSTLLTLALASCGGTSFEDKAASTTAPADSGSGSGSDSGSGGEDGFSAESTELGADILAQFDLQPDEIDELEAGCLGQTLIEALGESDARDVVTTETPSSEQLEALSAGFDACVSGRTLGPAITALFFGQLPGAPTPDQSVESCVAGEIDGSTGQLIIGLYDSSESGGLPVEFLDTLDVCVPDEVVADLLVAELTSDGTFDETQATCIAEQVAPQLPISALAAAGQSDTLPTEIEQLIEDATAACVLGG